MTTSQITVTDRAGNAHSVLAARRIDSFRVRVLREWKDGREFVVHMFNEADGGFHFGHYCATLERAQEIFNAA